MFGPARNMKCFSVQSGAVAYTNAYYGSGSGPYHLDNVHCGGSETSLLSCSHAVVGVHNCKHGDEAGVKCVGKLVGLNS